MISEETAHQIAFAYREIHVAEGLLKGIRDAVDHYESPDIRDSFGRPTHGLQFGVPSGDNSHRLFHVEWRLAAPIIEAHIASQRSIIAALSEKARTELTGPLPA